MFLVLISFSIQAQTDSPFQKPTSKSLYVGVQIPAEFYELKLNTIDLKTGNLAQIQLKDHRYKLIILDFWATWCPSCLGSLKHLHEIKSQLDTSKVLILPVNYQKPEEIKIIIDRFAWDHRSVHSDIDLGAFFPHQGIPHMVWIKDNKVHSMPYVSYSSADNIRKVINGEHPKILENQDVKQLTYEIPIHSHKDVNAKLKFINSHLSVYGYLEGYFPEDLIRTDTKDSVFISIVNRPLDNIIYDCFYSRISPYFELYYGAMRLNVDSLKSRYFISSKPSFSENADYVQDIKVVNWLKKNCYSFDFRFSNKLSETQISHSVRESVKEFLNNYLGLKAVKEMSEEKSIPIMTTIYDNKTIKVLFQKPLTPNGKAIFLQYPPKEDTREKFNQCVSVLLNKVNDLPLDYHKITDSSNFKGFDGMQFEIPRSFFFSKTLSFEQVQNFLESYGMKVFFKKVKLPRLLIESV